MNATTKTMTVAEALAEGYEKCLQDGSSHVEDLDDVDSADLEQYTYWICDKDATTFGISAESIRDCLSDHFCNIEISGDEDGEMGTLLANTVLKMDEALFEPLSKIVTERLSSHEWWYGTNIQLLP